MTPEGNDPSKLAPRPDLTDSTDPSPSYGKKGGFRKISATVPQGIYQMLIAESARRKIAGEPNRLVSALLREALTDYLMKLRAQPL